MDESRQCVAKKKTGVRCGRSAILGGTVCYSHGGAAGHVKAKALRRHAEAITRTEFAKLGMIDRIADPIGAMHDRVSEAAAWLEHLHGKMSDLDGDYTTWSGETGEQAKVIVKLYVEALNMSHKFLESWIRLNMDERRLAVDAAQAKLTLGAVVAVLDAALSAAGLSDAQKQTVRRTIGDAL